MKSIETLGDFGRTEPEGEGLDGGVVLLGNVAEGERGIGAGVEDAGGGFGGWGMEVEHGRVPEGRMCIG